MPGRAAHSYLRQSENGRLANVRTLKLLAFAGFHAYGLSIGQISRALNRSDSSVRQDLVDVQSALMLELDKLGIPSEAVFPRRTQAFDDGAGI